MLQKIRNLKFGYIIIVMGLVFILSGFSLKDSSIVERTLLCFDKGCMNIQAIVRNFGNGFFHGEKLESGSEKYIMRKSQILERT